MSIETVIAGFIISFLVLIALNIYNKFLIKKLLLKKGYDLIKIKFRLFGSGNRIVYKDQDGITYTKDGYIKNGELYLKN